MNTITIFQLIVAIALIVIVLLQQQGTGLGGAFGGEGNVYRSKRGVEKYLFYGTIVMAIAFFALEIVSIVKH